jgi:anaphase-promoting complex subunit 8
MKVANSAIPAYRKAVDINPKDYRAWYGLGMSYEICGMPLYALYYYGKACALRPHDTTMWCAMAECYEANDNIEEAIKCLKRAECNVDKGLALVRLAKLYKKLGEIDNAAYYFKKNLEFRDTKNIDIDQDQIDGIQFLAQYCKDNGNFEHATIYCNRLLDFESHQEEAKSLLREISSSQKPSDPVVLSPNNKQRMHLVI